MEKFGKFMLFIILYAINVFVVGVVLMFMWNWFIAPLGVTKIGFWLALGISLTITTFIGNNKSNSNNLYESIFINIVVNLILWGIGALIALLV